MRWLSGDHRGLPVTGPLKDVSGTQFAPVRSHVQISKLPERFDSKAILLPSGEKRGAVSSRVDEMSGLERRLGLAETDKSICQMFESPTE
jgi:hypothetical protein